MLPSIPAAAYADRLLPSPPLRLTTADIGGLSNLAHALAGSATQTVVPAQADVDSGANVGRLLVARGLYSLVDAGLRQQVADGLSGDDLPVQAARLAKLGAICLRDVGLQAPAYRALTEAAQRQGSLRDPDQSETWIIVSNLCLSGADPAAAAAAGRRAVDVAHQDSWPSRMREAVAAAGVDMADGPALDKLGRSMFGKIGHWYPQPSDQMMQNALQQLENATEALVDADCETDPARAAQLRRDVIQLSAVHLGATHEATLTRAAVLSNNNARLWMNAGEWRAALGEITDALELGRKANLGPDTMRFFSVRREECLRGLRLSTGEPVENHAVS